MSSGMKADDFNKLNPAVRQKIIETAHLVNRVFSTEDGKRLLEFWQEQFIFSDVANPNKSEAQVRHDGGKAAFILGIKQSMKIANDNRA